MSNSFKILFFCYFIFLFLQSCSSQKSSPSENMESAESTTQDKEENKNEDYAAGQSEESNEMVASKPMQQIVVAEQEFTIEKIAVSKEKSSESEQLSISNKSAKVLLFAKKLQKGSYPIATTSLPYASVHVTLTQGQEKIEGDLENGSVKLIVLDSAGITKGSFEGTLIKNNERYFIGGNFSN